MIRSLSVAVILAAAFAAWPATAQESLYGSGLVTPELAFPDVTVTPLRNDGERAAAGDTWVLAPILSLPIGDTSGTPPVLLRGVLRADQFVYEDLTEEGAEAAEDYRAFLQSQMDEWILPAAAGIPELAAYRSRFTSIQVAMNDVPEAGMQAFPWRPGTTPTPVITVDYGFSNIMGQYAGLSLDWDRLMALARQEQPNAEAVYMTSNRWLNVYATLIISGMRFRESGFQHFDRGVIEALFPPSREAGEAQLFQTHLSDTNLAVLSHEACHHILNHQPNDGIARRDKELAADRCAAHIFADVRMRTRPANVTDDLRVFYYWLAARELSVTSLLTWAPAGLTEAYPSPTLRYTNVIAAIPPDVLAAAPDLAEFVSTAVSLVPPDSFFENRAVLAAMPSYSPGDEAKSDLDREDALFAMETMLVDYCLARDCWALLQSDDPNQRYFNLRVLIDMAAVKLEIYRLTGGPELLLYQARRVLWSAQDAVTADMPIAQADIARLMDATQAALAALPPEDPQQQ